MSEVLLQHPHPQVDTQISTLHNAMLQLLQHIGQGLSEAEEASQVATQLMLLPFPGSSPKKLESLKISS